SEATSRTSETIFGRACASGWATRILGTCLDAPAMASPLDGRRALPCQPGSGEAIKHLRHGEGAGPRLPRDVLDAVAAVEELEDRELVARERVSSHLADLVV